MKSCAQAFLHNQMQKLYFVKIFTKLHYGGELCVSGFFLFCLDGEKIPNCTEEPLREFSLQRATDIEKILLSIPRFVRAYPLWSHHHKTSGQKYVWLSYFFQHNLSRFSLFSVSVDDTLMHSWTVKDYIFHLV